MQRLDIGTFVALAFVVGACGDDSTGSGGTGGGTSSSSASTTSGTTQASSTSSGNASSSSTGSGTPCDPVAQDCTDPVATKCTLLFDGDVMTFDEEQCMAPPGTAALGEACTRPTDTPGIDTCLDSYCANFGNAAAADRTCHTICLTSDICDAGSGCVALFTGEFGACSVECNPFPTNTCAAGVCSAAQHPGTGWGFNCFPSQGSTPDGDVCTTFDECLDGSGCDAGPSENANHCRPYCDATHSCTGGLTCQPFNSDTPGAEGVGICLP